MQEWTGSAETKTGWVVCLFTLLVSHTYECNADISVLTFIEKSWLTQNMDRTDLKLPLPIPGALAILPYAN